MRIAIICAAALTAATQSFAAPCDDDIIKIEAALKKDTVAADVTAQATDMVKQAKDLCAAGNETEGLAVTAEAKALLQVE
jgi:cytochrome c1